MLGSQLLLHFIVRIRKHGNAPVFTVLHKLPQHARDEPAPSCAVLRADGEVVAIPSHHLDHLRRGGRVTVLTNIAGKALGLKPLIEINQRVLATGKARGIAAANAGIIQTLESMGGILAEREYMLGYSTDPHQVDRLQDYITKTLRLPPAELGQIGASVGTHVGPGTFGIVFYDNTTYEW